MSASDQYDGFWGAQLSRKPCKVCKHALRQKTRSPQFAWFYSHLTHQCGGIEFAGGHKGSLRVLSAMTATIIAEILLGREHVMAFFQPLRNGVGEGLAHHDDDGEYRPLGVVRMEEPKPAKATPTQTDSQSTLPTMTRLKPLFIKPRKPLHLFPRRKPTT